MDEFIRFFANNTKNSGFRDNLHFRAFVTTPEMIYEIYEHILSGL